MLVDGGSSCRQSTFSYFFSIACTRANSCGIYIMFSVLNCGILNSPHKICFGKDVRHAFDTMLLKQWLHF